MAKRRNSIQDLQSAGHLEGASDSLMAELSQALSSRDEQMRLGKIRRAMLLAIATIDGVDFFSDRIHAAADLQALWALRDELMLLVSEHHEPERARQLLLPITAMFLGETRN